MTGQSVSNSAGHSTVLKLLSGPQQGAEAQLNDGTSYLIGGDDECDIVLQGESVAPKHLRLVVEPGRIHLDVQEQPVVVGNRHLPSGQTTDFPTGVVIQLGKVCIGVGPENTDWSQAVWPDIGKTPDETVDRNTTAEAESGESQPPSPPPAQGAQEEPPAPPAKSRSLVKDGLALGAIIFAVLALIMGWRPLNDWLNTDATVEGTTPEPSAVEKTRAIIAKLGLPDINITARPDGGVVLTGYCETRQVKNRLTAALQAQGMQVDNQLWPEEVLREAISHTLERLGGKALSYNYLGKGVLHLRGRLRTGLHHDQLLSTLRNDVPAINRIESEVRPIEDFAMDLQKQVRQAGLEEQITIVAEGEGITVTGALDAERMDRWNAIAQSFVAETQGFLTLDQRLRLIGGRQKTPPAAPKEVEKEAGKGLEKESSTPLRIAVRGIVIGPDQVPHALLDDGTRVMEGDWIEGRYFVEKIQFNRVIVRDGSKVKTYYIGESEREQRVQ